MRSFAIAAAIAAIVSANNTAKAQTKICSPVVPNHWRTTLPVPADWSYPECAQWANTVGADRFQLGCIWDHKHAPPRAPAGYFLYSWGKLQLSGVSVDQAVFPNPDCGWVPHN